MERYDFGVAQEGPSRSHYGARISSGQSTPRRVGQDAAPPPAQAASAQRLLGPQAPRPTQLSRGQPPALGPCDAASMPLRRRRSATSRRGRRAAGQAATLQVPLMFFVLLCQPRPASRWARALILSPPPPRACATPSAGRLDPTRLARTGRNSPRQSGAPPTRRGLRSATGGPGFDPAMPPAVTSLCSPWSYSWELGRAKSRDLGTENSQKGEVGLKDAARTRGLQFCCTNFYAPATMPSAQMAEWHAHNDFCNTCGACKCATALVYVSSPDWPRPAAETDAPAALVCGG